MSLQIVQQQIFLKIRDGGLLRLSHDWSKNEPEPKNRILKTLDYNVRYYPTYQDLQNYLNPFIYETSTEPFCLLTTSQKPATAREYAKYIGTKANHALTIAEFFQKYNGQMLYYYQNAPQTCYRTYVNPAQQGALAEFEQVIKQQITQVLCTSKKQNEYFMERMMFTLSLAHRLK